MKIFLRIDNYDIIKNINKYHNIIKGLYVVGDANIAKIYNFDLELIIDLKYKNIHTIMYKCQNIINISKNIVLGLPFLNKMLKFYNFLNRKGIIYFINNKFFIRNIFASKFYARYILLDYNKQYLRNICASYINFPQINIEIIVICNSLKQIVKSFNVGIDNIIISEKLLRELLEL